MQTTADLFEVDLEGDTLVVTPCRNLRELDFHEIEEETETVVNLLRRGPARNVVVDLHRTDYCGSTALGSFAQLWQVVKVRKGCMAFCNVSDHEKEILQITNLDHLWPICSSRSEALEAVKA
jgi:anti-anti-sigma factor